MDITSLESFLITEYCDKLRARKEVQLIVSLHNFLELCASPPAKFTLFPFQSFSSSLHKNVDGDSHVITFAGDKRLDWLT
jgi:hypothetical protein